MFYVGYYRAVGFIEFIVMTTGISYSSKGEQVITIHVRIVSYVT